MPLARLENFLKNLNGNTIYVDPNELDSTDSIENRGNSRLRPFKTIQRALIEAARFAYIPGSNNDLFDQTTILISAGTHYIDNRPGYYYDGSSLRDINGSVKNITELSIASDLNLNNFSNELHIYNSVHGGVIIPKGVSIVSSDLRKTKIRPLFVPDPVNDLIESSAIFRLTGASYIFGFSILDGDPLGTVYNTYANNKVSPSYSHHKLTAFEYADGKNFYTKNGVTSNITDLDTYYYKLSLAFGGLSGREIPNNFTSFQKNPEENKIVGDLGKGFILIDPDNGIISGDGTTASQTITVTTQEPHELTPLTPILISGVGTIDSEEAQAEYNGVFVVAQVTSPTSFNYILSEIPNSTANPSTLSATVKILSDTVSSSSPYVFNCSLKSVYGMNGLHADGSKATGFKSIVTAQFTGISLQRDDRAFVKYNDTTGTYQTQEQFGSSINLHQQSTSRHRPGWETFHILASNDAFIQCVSIFAIGYSKQFVADNGGDQSVTNSNSNFGAVALSSKGFKDYELSKDNHGFITHIIPPKDVLSEVDNVNYFVMDSSLTESLSVSNGYQRVYINGYDDLFTPPPKSIKNFIVGAKDGEIIYYSDASGEIRSATVSPNYQQTFRVDSIDTSTSIITVEGTISGISTGQAVRFVSNTGSLPDGIDQNKVYYVHRDITSNTLRISENITSANDPNGYLLIRNDIGVSPEDNITIYARVSDTIPGQTGNPIQWDPTNNNWYIGIEANENFTSGLLNLENKPFYIKRVTDGRSVDDKIYRVRIVIPKESSLASEPSPGFIIQKSSSLLDSTFSQDNLIPLNPDEDDQLSLVRNTNIISDAWYENGTATVITSKPHKLKSGNKIKIYNLKSSTEPNPVGLGTGLGYNGSFEVASVVSDVQFTYNIDRNPGAISTATGMTVANWMDRRVCSSGAGRYAPYTILSSNRGNLPYFTQESLTNDYQLYKIKPIQRYVQGISDGIYHITLNSFKNIPDVSPFNIDDYKLSQNIDYLYPKTDKDNPVSDPQSAVSYPNRQIIGKVEVNSEEYSTTKETINQLLKDTGDGFEISSIVNSTGTSTLTTTINHGLGGIRTLTLAAAGSGYTPGTYYDIPLCSSGGSGEGATVKVTITAGGAILLNNITILNPGSGYTIGESVIIRGLPGSTSQTTLTVGTVFTENVGAIQVLGALYPENNGCFPIQSSTRNTITYRNSTGRTETNSPAVAKLLPSYTVQSATYNAVDDTTTITTNSFGHPFTVGNKVILSNSTYDVLGTLEVVSTSSLTNLRVRGNYVSATQILPPITSQLKDTNVASENIGTRLIPFFNGYRTRLNTVGGITSSIATFSLEQTVGLNKGDFIQIDDEIMLILSINSSTNITVKRAVLGTLSNPHIDNSIVEKLNSHPIELRRNSIIRASGHTFEYTGFGPGNYSTGMPTNQDRILNSDEVLISQALSTRGGLISYTGMNSNGEFYIGRKKYDSTTGEEISIGDEPQDEVSFIDSLVVNRITVNKVIDAETARATFKEVQVVGVSTFFNQVTINSLTDSQNCTTGALVVAGGVGIGKSLNVCGSTTLSGTSISNIRIGISGSNEIDTSTGNLTLDSAGGTVTVDDNLSVAGSSTFTGLIDANGGATIDNVRIGIAADNEIDTSTGNLTLDSAGGTVTVDDNLSVAGSSTFTGNVTVSAPSTFNGYGTIPLGGIIMWSGSIETIPVGWALCNGGNGTPDLRERFIVGASLGNNTSVPGGFYSVGDTGGSRDAVVVSHSHTASSSNAPDHRHDLGGDEPGNPGMNLAGDHFHRLRDGTGGDQTNSITTDGGNLAGQNNQANFVSNSNIIEPAGDHVHTGVTKLAGGHGHTITVTAEGVSGTDANLPPYYALAFIMRVL